MCVWLAAGCSSSYASLLELSDIVFDAILQEFQGLLLNKVHLHQRSVHKQTFPNRCMINPNRLPIYQYISVLFVTVDRT